MLYVLIWWFLMEVMGLAVLPLALRLFRHLPDRGYAFAKPLGLLLVSYVFWLLGSLGFLRNSVGGIVFALAVVMAVSVWLGRGQEPSPGEFVQRHRRLVLTVEALFALSFFLFALFRAYNPEIVGTEKPMEFAFLNAILRSERFPPHDPWLSGFAISYYYFGYVMMAMLARLSGVPSGVAFNLGIALLFALTSTGAFGLVYNLVARSEGRRLATLYGLLGSTLVAVVGNLEGVLEILHCKGIGSTAFWKWVDIKNLAEMPQSPTWHPIDHWWWWRASRVLKDYNPLGMEQEVIDEFPFFSFLLGDMHPHVLALPFVLVAVALAMEVFFAEPPAPSLRPPSGGLGERIRRSGLVRQRGWEVILFALCLGALGFLNTWDFPVYLLLFLLAYALRRRAGNADWVEDVAVTALVMGVVGVLLYLPFYVGFQSQAGGILPVLFNKTRIHQYLIMFGLFIYVVVGLTLTKLREWWAEVRAKGRPRELLGIVALSLAVVALSASMRRWLPVVLTVLMAPMALWLLAFRPSVSGEEREAHRHLASAFALLLALLGLLLTFAVEWVYLKDAFGTRMNTVFKFYYQAWVMLALASAYGVYYVGKVGRVGRWPFLLGFVVLLAAGMVYPVAAGYTRAGGFARQPTLDGTVHLRQAYPDDYAAVRWLNENVKGAPVILEATGGSFSQYGRISAHTGLPTVLGWDFHEMQWRGSYEEPGKRKPDIDRLYRSANRDEVLALLEKYDIRYIYVGVLERNQYGPQVLAKFDRLAEPVYRQGEVVIYRVGRE